ncbi:MAG: galactose mutarotase [Rikenellaceae bacterium]|nr:galactose mutarotase [Rikenellaceae bacterium]
MIHIEQHVWGFTDQGEAVILYTMTNAEGAYVQLTNLGAAIVGIGVPDRTGTIEDVALGYADFHDYFGDSGALGKTVGRFANRIAQGRFTLEGKEYKLATNNGRNHLHGGPKGFGEVLWESRVEVNRVVFSYISPDGEERYPGSVGVEVVYDWNEPCELEITYHAKTDTPTLVNLTNHVYFNLRGEGSGDILSQELKLHCSRYLPTDSGSIPLGEQAPVAGTPMDFTRFKPIGQEIEADTEQLRFGNGYDHFWIIDGWQPGRLSEAAELYDPVSGRLLTVLTTQPGLMVYTGNYLQGLGRDKTGKELENRAGVALECQNYPDAPNHPDFPSAALYPGENYRQQIIYRFGIR